MENSLSGSTFCTIVFPGYGSRFFFSFFAFFFESRGVFLPYSTLYTDYISSTVTPLYNGPFSCFFNSPNFCIFVPGRRVGHCTIFESFVEILFRSFFQLLDPVGWCRFVLLFLSGLSMTLKLYSTASLLSHSTTKIWYVFDFWIWGEIMGFWGCNYCEKNKDDMVMLLGGK